MNVSIQPETGTRFCTCIRYKTQLSDYLPRDWRLSALSGSPIEGPLKPLEHHSNITPRGLRGTPEAAFIQDGLTRGLETPRDARYTNSDGILHFIMFYQKKGLVLTSH